MRDATVTLDTIKAAVDSETIGIRALAAASELPYSTAWSALRGGDPRVSTVAALVSGYARLQSGDVGPTIDVVPDHGEVVL
jgi:predicted transcriptional regulator